MTANFEFRVWGADADALGRAIRRRGRPSGQKAGGDSYLLLAGEPSLGIKARDGRLDVKQRIEVVDGLERWQPVFSAAFPLVSVRKLPERIAAAAGDRKIGSIEDLREAVQASFPGALVVRVGKRRRLFDLAGCKAEVDEVEVRGRLLACAALEHEDAQALADVLAEVARNGWRNAGYPEMLLEIATEESRGAGN